MGTTHFCPNAWLTIAGEPVALGLGEQPCRGAHPGTPGPQTTHRTPTMSQAHAASGAGDPWIRRAASNT